MHMETVSAADSVAGSKETRFNHPSSKAAATGSGRGATFAASSTVVQAAMRLKLKAKQVVGGKDKGKEEPQPVQSLGHGLGARSLGQSSDGFGRRPSSNNHHDATAPVGILKWLQLLYLPPHYSAVCFGPLTLESKQESESEKKSKFASILDAIERVTGFDLDGDGTVAGEVFCEVPAKLRTSFGSLGFSDGMCRMMSWTFQG